MPPSDPRETYQTKFEERSASVSLLENSDQRLSSWRGISFFATLLLWGVGYSQWNWSAAWVWCSGALFAGFVAYHGRIVGKLQKARLAVDFYSKAIDRLQNNWKEQGTTGERYQDEDHLYTNDLDVFGDGGLFQFINQSRTRLGEDTLAAWLGGPAEKPEILVRQKAIDELRPAVDLREQLALLDAEVHDDLDQNRLIDWSKEKPQPISPLWRCIAVLISSVLVFAIVGWLLLGMRSTLLIVMLIVQTIFIFPFAGQIRRLVQTISATDAGLLILSQVLKVIEEQNFTSEKLQRIQKKLNAEGLPPSTRIAQLHRYVAHLHNCIQNQFFIPISFVLGLPIHAVHRIESWRGDVAHHIPDWLEAVGEFEALSSFAGFAYERPANPFPEIVEGPTCFDGKQIGHPLLAEESCVRNDLTLNDQQQLVLISGSNMSGKSTLLRTVGLNSVLALAGAPVRAERLTLCVLNIGTAIRVHDSLQEGHSLFYAVLRRLKAVTELTASENRPLFFLLDEILQGTNSHDRRVGSEGVIRKLVESNAIGLVTTHDLALTQIVDSLDGKASNAHFEDTISDGEMTFDYRLKPGVVQRSNALELMRIMGLNV